MFQRSQTKRRRQVSRSQKINRAVMETLEARQLLSFNPTVATGLVGYNGSNLPLLNSRPQAPAAIFLDFNGYDTDGNPASYSASEQTDIENSWQQVTSYFSIFDVNVTTVQPNVYTTPTAWDQIANNNGDWSNIWVFPNYQVQSYNSPGAAQGRYSEIAHEVGHNFGNFHQSDFDLLGNLVNEYSSGYDALHGPLMGVDNAQSVHKWFLGHPNNSPSVVQDDMAAIANGLKVYDHGDGYAPDDFGGSIATATAMTANGNVQSSVGVIERLTDADAFSFNSTGGLYSINVTTPNSSQLAPVVNIYDANGNLVARGGTPGYYSGSNSQGVSVTLSSGTYYAIVSSQGNYDDLGEYNLTATAQSMPTGWGSVDIGGPQSGSANYSGGTYTVVGGGLDIWNSADQFHFAYQTLTGDGSIIAKVTGMDNTDPWAKAGVMIRDGNNPNAVHIDMVVTPGNGVSLQSRNTTGGGSGYYQINGITTPVWLKLVRSGNQFSGYYSTDGTTWVQAYVTQAINMSTTTTIGLAVTSHNTGVTNTSTFTNVSTTGMVSSQTVYNALSAPTGLALTTVNGGGINLGWNAVSGATGYGIWRSVDGVTYFQVGSTSGNGSTSYSDANLPGSMLYFYKVTALDGSANQSTPSAVASATNAPATPASFTVTRWYSGQLILNWHDVPGETSYRIERSTNGTDFSTVATVGANVPSYTDSGLTANTTYWYRVIALNASGESTAATGSAMTRIGQISGLAYTTIASNQMAFQWTALTGVSNYKIERSTDGSTYTTLATIGAGTTSYTDNTVTPLGQYYYRVSGLDAGGVADTASSIFAASPATTALPYGWQAQDIGVSYSQGATGYDGVNGTYTMVGTGSDIWNTSDQFRYSSMPLSGDGSIIAKVDSHTNTSSWAKSGVMIRDGSATDAKFVDVVVTPGNGVSLQWRGSTGGGCGYAQVTGIAAPAWVKLTRTGDVFTGYCSTDGITWTQVGNPQTITMSASTQIGLAVCSGNAGRLNTTVFSNVAVNMAGVSAPTVVNAASATQNADNSFDLSVLGGDVNGENNLYYSWAVTNAPTGAGPAIFQDNGTNSAKNTAVRFDTVGSYTLTATITNAFGLNVTSSVNVNVTTDALSLIWTGGGANGNWSNSANWSNGWTPLAGDALIFTGSTQTTTNNDLVGYTFSSISIQGDNFTLGGNSVTLSPDIGPAISNSGAGNVLALSIARTAATDVSVISGTLTLSAALTGSYGLIKDGSGTLTLSSSGTNYSGATTVNAGTLKLTGATAFASATTVASGATLELAGSTSIDHPAGFGLTLNSGSTLNKTNTGYDTFNSSNVAINGTVTINITNNGSSNQLFIGGSSTGLTGAGIINLTNSGTTTTGLSLRTGAGSFSGDLNITGGVLNVGSGASLALQNTDLTLTGAILNLNGSFAVSAGPASIKSLAGNSASSASLGAQALTLGTNNGTGASFAGVIGGTGTLTKTGSGVQILTGVNTYTGATAINGGSLTISGSGKLGSGNYTSAITMTNSGSVLNYASSATQTFSGAVTQSGGGWTGLNASAGLLTLSGTVDNAYLQINITGGEVDAGKTVSTSRIANIVTVGGTGILKMLNSTSNQIYSNLTVSSGGTVDLNGQTQGLAVNTTTAMNLNGGSLINSTGTDSWTNPVALGANSTIGGAGALNITGVVSGSFGLTKTGAGTATLSGANTYSGGTTVSGGTLNATVNATQNSIGTGAAVINSGTLLLNNTNTTGTTTLSNAFSGAGTLKLNFAAGTTARNTYMSNVGGMTGTIRLSNSGATGDKWNANGVSAASAAVIIDSGSQLFVSGADTFESVSAIGTGNSETRGAIRLASTLTAPVSLAGATTIGSEGGTINGTITSGVAGAQTLTIGTTNSTGNATLNGIISNGSGTVALTKTQTGTLTLSAANTYTGATTVSAGTMTVTGSIAGSVTVNSGATLSGTGTLHATTINSGGTLSPGGTGIGTLTVSGALTLAGTLNMHVNASTGACDKIQGITTLTFGGVLNVTNLAGTLTSGKTFTLFSFSSHSGTFSSISLPALGSGLSWDTSTLYTNGTIRVV